MIVTLTLALVKQIFVLFTCFKEYLLKLKSYEDQQKH